jgi:hypothetical protein
MAWAKPPVAALPLDSQGTNGDVVVVAFGTLLELVGRRLAAPKPHFLWRIHESLGDGT